MRLSAFSKQKGKKWVFATRRTVVITGAGGGLEYAYALPSRRKVQMWWSTTSVPEAAQAVAEEVKGRWWQGAGQHG